MGGSVMTQRQDEHFQIECGRTLRRAAGADQVGLRAICGALDDAPDFWCIIAPPEFQERLAAQFPAEQGIGAAADDAQRKAALGRMFENECVGEHAANRPRLDVVTLGRAARAAQGVPIRIEFQAGREFQNMFPWRSRTSAPKRDRRRPRRARRGASCTGHASPKFGDFPPELTISKASGCAGRWAVAMCRYQIGNVGPAAPA